MAKTQSKIPHTNTKVLLDLKTHKPQLDSQADEKGILPTTLATMLLIEAIKKGASK